MEEVKRRAFYVFMASHKLPWSTMWAKLWGMIPEPETDGRMLLALDDCTNLKVGKKIFACSHVFDHAAKANQSKYPWAQCFTAIGLLNEEIESDTVFVVKHFSLGNEDRKADCF